MKNIVGDQRGQTSSEYMLLVSVIVLGLVAAASTLVPRFRSGVETLSDNVGSWVETDQTMQSVDDGEGEGS